MNKESLMSIADQVLRGKKLHEIDFGEPKLDLEEKLRNIDLAIRQYPTPDSLGTWGETHGKTGSH